MTRLRWMSRDEVTMARALAGVPDSALKACRLDSRARRDVRRFVALAGKAAPEISPNRARALHALFQKVAQVARQGQP